LAVVRAQKLIRKRTGLGESLFNLDMQWSVI
jgi:hypothetical protein